jgi:hypothetical protein
VGFNLPEMVLLEAMLTGARKVAGRATFEAIEVASLEASTRVDAIVSDGGERV